MNHEIIEKIDTAIKKVWLEDLKIDYIIIQKYEKTY